jgi:HD-GYP domain-containing protein (c-di-GMP phosphodiesterase class II)
MRLHPVESERIVGAVPSLAHLAASVRAEHERWDGGGYPDGLACETIPIAARIVLACDAYDAMMTDRPYRKAMGHEAAVFELATGAGSQFDLEVVGVLLGVLSEEARQGGDAAYAESASTPTRNVSVEASTASPSGTPRTMR